jgi:hypothetical protein
MAKEIEFEGTTHVFPDDFTDADIGAALKSAHPQSEANAALARTGLTASEPKKAPLPPGLQPDKSAWEDPTQGLIGQGVRQIGRGVAAMAEPGKRAKYEGLSEAIRGAGKAALPFAVPMALASPISALGAATAGIAGSELGRAGARAINASPEGEALAGDIAGIATGGVGSKLGTAAESALARPAIKTALRLPAKSEAFGNDPAQMALEHTSGVRPATIARSAQQTMDRVRPEMERIVASSTQPVDLAPARDIIANASELAARQGNKLVHGQLEPMAEALQGNRVTGVPYVLPNLTGRAELSPREALDLKRGFGDEFVTWNPDIHVNTNAAAKNVYGNLAEQIHNAAPGSAERDAIMQGLIPVKHAAEKTEMAPTLGQRVLTRVSRPTGGMLPALIGFHEGGPLGAAAGLVGAEGAASPVPMAIAARALHAAGKTEVPPIIHIPLEYYWHPAAGKRGDQE